MAALKTLWNRGDTMKLLLYIVVSTLIALTLYFLPLLELNRFFTSIILGVTGGVLVYVMRVIIDKYEKK